MLSQEHLLTNIFSLPNEIELHVQLNSVYYSAASTCCAYSSCENCSPWPSYSNLNFFSVLEPPLHSLDLPPYSFLDSQSNNTVYNWSMAHRHCLPKGSYRSSIFFHTIALAPVRNTQARIKSANAGSILKYMTKHADVWSKPKLSIKNKTKLFLQLPWRSVLSSSSSSSNHPFSLPKNF